MFAVEKNLVLVALVDVVAPSPALVAELTLSAFLATIFWRHVTM